MTPEHYDKIFNIYDRIMRTKAEELYPIPAEYILIYQGKEYDCYVVDYKGISYHQDKHEELFNELIGLLKGICNVIALSGTISEPYYQFFFQIGISKSPYEIIKVK